MHTDTTPRGADQATAPPHLPTYVTVAQLIQIEPALTRGGLRDDLFNRASNGLEASGAVIYRGRKILLHRERYLSWLEKASQRRAAA